MSDTRARLADLAGLYREWIPHNALRCHLRCFWVNSFAARERTAIRVVPDGCMDIIWDGEELRVAGPDTHAMFAIVPAGVTIVGARFRPGVAPQWLKISAAELVNSRPLLEEFWPADGARLSAELSETRDAGQVLRVLERTLLARLPKVRPPDPVISGVLYGLMQSQTDSPAGWWRQVGMGLSERTLRRRSIAAFGYGPKTLDRVLRFQRFLRRIPSHPRIGLSELAAEVGFADQAHLTRETRRLSGLTPKDFISEFLYGRTS